MAQSKSKSYPGGIKSVWTHLSINHTWCSIPIRFFKWPYYAGIFKEQRWQKIISTAATLALLISFMDCSACTFKYQQRVKRNQYKKSSRASVHNILSLLAKRLYKVSVDRIDDRCIDRHYILNAWLKNFAYRIDLHWWLIVTEAMVVILLSLATVSIQGLK